MRHITQVHRSFQGSVRYTSRCVPYVSRKFTVITTGPPLALHFGNNQKVVTDCPPLALSLSKGLGVISASPPFPFLFVKAQGVITTRPPLALSLGKRNGVVTAHPPLAPCRFFFLLTYFGGFDHFELFLSISNYFHAFSIKFGHFDCYFKALFLLRQRLKGLG